MRAMRCTPTFLGRAWRRAIVLIYSQRSATIKPHRDAAPLARSAMDRHLTDKHALSKARNARCWRDTAAHAHLPQPLATSLGSRNRTIIFRSGVSASGGTSVEEYQHVFARHTCRRTRRCRAPRIDSVHRGSLATSAVLRLDMPSYLSSPRH